MKSNFEEFADKLEEFTLVTSDCIRSNNIDTGNYLTFLKGGKLVAGIDMLDSEIFETDGKYLEQVFKNFENFNQSDIGEDLEDVFEGDVEAALLSGELTIELYVTHEAKVVSMVLNTGSNFINVNIEK